MAGLDQVALVRSVWDHNLEHEICIIADLMGTFRFAAFDTEFPGVVYPSDHQHFNLTAEERYSNMKQNVNDLHLIQVGLAFCDEDGRLPRLDENSTIGVVWEFNLLDFDVNTDLHNLDSIKLLESSGIDFQKNRRRGISSCKLAYLLVQYEIVGTWQHISWVTFHGAYDFAFMVKILMTTVHGLGDLQELPETLEEFLMWVTFYFGDWCDMKHIINHCEGLHGGLERVAKALQVEREAGNSHTAGSDSLLTLQAFLKMKDTFFEEDRWQNHKHLLHGMEP